MAHLPHKRAAVYLLKLSAMDLSLLIATAAQCSIWVLAGVDDTFSAAHSKADHDKVQVELKLSLTS